MTTFQPLDVIRVSVTSPAAEVVSNRDVEVAKLIDVSKCIGCKACQSACLEWNDKRPPVGENAGDYENPADLHAGYVHGDALHRVGQSQNGQPRMAHPQGWLHALRGPRLSQGLSVARRHRAICERDRGLPTRHERPGRRTELPRHSLLREGRVRSISPVFHRPDRVAYKCTLCSDGSPLGRNRPVSSRARRTPSCLERRRK